MADLQSYRESLLIALDKPRSSLGLTIDEVVEEQTTIFEQMRDYAEQHDLTEDPLYDKAREAYDGEVKKDELAIKEWLDKSKKEKRNNTNKWKDFAQYRKKGRKGTAPEMELENYEVWKILHMRQDSEGNLLSSDGNRRVTLAQIRDGSFRNHYEYPGEDQIR
ncbi:MAG: hypothetical protein ABIH72_00515 [archaeon]